MSIMAHDAKCNIARLRRRLGTLTYLQNTYYVRACNASGCSAWVQFPAA
jgi:hypothetical protein